MHIQYLCFIVKKKLFWKGEKKKKEAIENKNKFHIFLIFIIVK